ncbi:ABC transporter substrate-binding protein [Streptomyces coerulescens]|uniref:ABC transporter substrate-binding protein n=1 Tax=Streptomyces coerulescens TaxID=29304 RepID=A0ABW0CXL6_STRCD
MMLIALAGCGVGGGEKDSASKIAGCDIPEASQKSGPIDGPIKGEITFETLGLKGAFKEFFTAQIKRFEDAHPAVKINWVDDTGGAEYITRLTTNVKVCKIPDVINTDIQGVSLLSGLDLAMDMGDRLPKVGDNYTPETWKAVVPPGKTGHVSLPWYTGYPSMLYNKDLMKKVGLSKVPTTYDEYFAALKTIAEKADGKFYGDWGSPQYMLPDAFAARDVKIMNSAHTEFTFASDPAALDWLSNLADAYKAGAFPKDSITGDPNASEAFAAGKIVFGQAHSRTVRENAPDVYKVTGYARLMDDQGGGPLISGQHITVPKTTKNPAAALAFAEFVTSTKEQEALCSDNGVTAIPPMSILPASAKCYTDPAYDALERAGMAGHREAQQKAQYDPVVWFWNGAVSEAVVPQLQLAMQGKKSPQEALQAAEDAANKVIPKAP